jgi:hypothetical protein
MMNWRYCKNTSLKNFNYFFNFQSSNKKQTFSNQILENCIPSFNVGDSICFRSSYYYFLNVIFFTLLSKLCAEIILFKFRHYCWICYGFLHWSPIFIHGKLIILQETHLLRIIAIFINFQNFCKLSFNQFRKIAFQFWFRRFNLLWSSYLPIIDDFLEISKRRFLIKGTVSPNMCASLAS